MIGLNFIGDNENRAERKARFLPQIEYTFAHKNHNRHLLLPGMHGTKNVKY